ncbi:glycine/D-amino acid oxidase-like deaminating enzyme [Bradyrhizobium japonicum]
MTVAPKREAYDVVVIGAGPAGLAAAATSAEAGLSTLLLDENIGPGGQVFRAISSTPVTDRNQLGADYWVGADLVQSLRASRAEIIHRATVWSLDRNLEIAVSIGGASAFLKAQRVILATGALERPFPIPGWTLPGVMTAGAAQTMLKSSALVPDGRTVIAGQGPLLWLLAAQILRLGGRIDRILDTTERGNYFAALPHAFAFLTSPYFTKGLSMMREVKTKVQVVSGVTELAAAGEGQLASVSYVAGGKRETIPADLLLLHQGVVPNVNLAMAAGIEHRWDDLQLCWSPVLDASGNSSVAGIAIAGDGAGIGRCQCGCGPWPHRGARGGGGIGACGCDKTCADGDAPRRSRQGRARPRLPRHAVPARAAVPHSHGRHYRLPLRGSHREGPSRCRRHRRDRAEPAQGLSPHRHGPVPGPALRPDRDRADGAGAGQDGTGDRLLPAARAGQANHARRARRCPEERGRRQSGGARMTQNVDAIVVGGGIHGCSTALHLCLAGMKPVLIEKDYAGRHASGVNAGGVRQLARHVPEIPLSIRSMGIWEKITDLLDDDCSFESYGQVLVAENEEELAVCRTRVAELNALGFTHEELIDATELRRLVPAVAETCPGGVVSRRDGAANPAQTTTAFRRKAEQLGATVREGVAASNIRQSDGLWHVDVGTETFAAPVLVNAAGAWAGNIAAALGEPVPVETVAPMLMITSRVPHFIDPVVILRGRKLSFKQFSNGTVLIGGGHLATPYQDRNETVLDWKSLAISARTVFELFPVMRSATIVRAWAGIEAKMKDDIPVFGPSSRHKGLYHQFGFSLHGFQLGPGAGAVMAELIVNGGTQTRIGDLGIDRFHPSTL